jgi:hypothetical protein
MRVEHMFSGRRCRNKALKQTLMSWGRRDFILANMAEDSGHRGRAGPEYGSTVGEENM